MKSTFKKTLLGIAVSLSLINCRNDDSTSSVTPTPTPVVSILPTKQTNIDKNGNTTSVTINKYDFDKIIESVDDKGVKTVFTYSGDNIIKMITPDNITFTFDYDTNGKLSKKTMLLPNGGKLEEVYTYVTDLQIKSVQTFSMTNQPNIVTNYIYDFYTAGGNLKRSYTENIIDSNNMSSTTIYYEYDTKNNPRKNVKGLGKLMFAVTSQPNNVMNVVYNYVSKNNGQMSQRTTSTLYQYQYNSNDYPIAIYTKQFVNGVEETTKELFEYNK